MIYAFGAYELDTQLYELRRAGTPCKLEPQAFNVLAYLIAQRTRVVTKQELLDGLWPHHSVSESTLTQRLKAVRKAVGDDGRTQQVIKTVHGRGYRFVAPLVERDSETPATPPLGIPDGPPPGAGQAHSASSPPVGERKLVTVLCGALADTATVAEQHGFEVLRRVRAAFFALVQSEVQRYAGRLQPLGDDGFLALFGVPDTQEDHALRAVLAAGGMQQQLHERGRDDDSWSPGTLQGRFGVHTGLMRLGKGPDGVSSLTTVLGDDAALAMQLQSLAAPGMLLASATTMQLVQGVVRSDVWTGVPVSGRAGRMLVHRVQAIAPWRVPHVWQQRRLMSRFVGRERELATLQALLAQAANGQGHVVGIVGEPGIGKSRLLHEFRHRCALQRVVVLEGHCLSYDTATPYVPVLDLLRHHCGLTETHDAETTTAQVLHRLQEQGMPVKEDAPYLLRLLRVSEGPESLPGLSPLAVKERTFAILRRLFLHSTSQPRIVMVENLHWVDATSEAWLTSLVAHLAGAALLLLTTYRPGYHPPWIEKSYVTQLALTPLVRRDSLSVVQSVPQAERLRETVVHEILGKAGGNPFFLEELTWSAVHHRDLQTPPLLPDTIQAVLAARIDRLPPLEKRLLQVAAVIGKDILLSLLQAVTELPEGELAPALVHLQATEFLYEFHHGPLRTYRFKHALTRDTAYQSLLANTRKQLHQRIAQILLARFPETAETQPELLAHHYTEAGLYTLAVEYWQRAGESAVQRSAHVEAVHHLTTGLALLQALPESLTRTQHELFLQTALGSALMATRGFSASEVAQVYARARELCQQVGNTPQLFTVLCGLCHYYNVRAEFQTASALGEQCLAIAQHHHDPALLAMAHYMLGTNCYWRGALTAARTHLAAGLAFSTVQPPSVLAMRSGPDSGVTCFGRTGIVLWLLGYPDQALASLQKAVTLAHKLSHPFSLAYALINVATVHLFRREMQEVQKWAEAVIALTTEQDFSQWLANGTVLRGWIQAMQGQGVEGIAQMRQGISAWQATGAMIFQPYLFALLAEAYGHTEQPEAGLPVLAEALALVDKTGERWCEAELYRLQGELLLAPDGKRPGALGTGQQWKAAEASFHQALDIARCQQAKSLELRTALSLSRLWQRQGKQGQIRELLAPIYGWFTEGFDTADLRETKALLGELGI